MNKPASLKNRARAFSIDVCAPTGLFIFIVIVYSLLKTDGAVLWLIDDTYYGICLLLLFMYFIYSVFCTYKYNQTFGQKRMGLSVISTKGNKVTMDQAITRTGYFLFLLPILSLFFLTDTYKKQKQTGWDYYTNTMVIEK